MWQNLIFAILDGRKEERVEKEWKEEMGEEEKIRTERKERKWWRRRIKGKERGRTRKMRTKQRRMENNDIRLVE